MTREENWLAFGQALKSLPANARPLRICLDSYFADEHDWESLSVLFPFFERIGLIVPDVHAAAIYRKMFQDEGWDKVVPIVRGFDSTDAYDIIVNRW